MCHAVLAGNWTAARSEQQWKQRVAAVFGSFAGDSERTVYRRLAGIEMGPPRPPAAPLAESDYTRLVAALDDVGFWSQGPVPGPCVLA